MAGGQEDGYYRRDRVSDLFHECRSDEGMGYVLPLVLHPLKTPYKPTISDMEILEAATQPNPLKYYENWGCRNCSINIMKLILS